MVLILVLSQAVSSAVEHGFSFGRGTRLHAWVVLWDMENKSYKKKSSRDETDMAGEERVTSGEAGEKYVLEKWAVGPWVWV